MNERRKPVLTGGCQCGAVRYALYAEPHDPHVCHCRMCQKAFGSIFAPLASVQEEDFAWTRGAASIFRSSAGSERGFCRECGTPLMVRYVDQPYISFSLGSLDEPARVAPRVAYGIESKVPWADSLPALKGTATEDSTSPEQMAKNASLQHPDHDTEVWPPR